MSELIGKLTVPTEATATLIDKNISSNGTYNASEDSADGYKKVVVDIPLMTQKTITENGTYNASDDNADGYKSVLVNVSGGSDCVNPNYEWYANEDKTLVIRRKLFDSNNKYYRIQDAPYRIYFNWFDINTVSEPFQKPTNPPFITANLGGQGSATQFLPSNSLVYADCDQTDYGGASDTHGYIGFYGGTIRGWTVGLEYNQVGKYRAIYESTYPSGAVDNPTPWEEPTFDPING